MKTTQELLDQAQRCLRLARETTDDKLAGALLAYGCELEARARQMEVLRTQPSQRRREPALEIDPA